MLFNVYLLNIEEALRKKGEKGVQIRREKMWSLTYVDDIPTMAKRSDKCVQKTEKVPGEERTHNEHKENQDDAMLFERRGKKRKNMRRSETEQEKG